MMVLCIWLYSGCPIRLEGSMHCLYFSLTHCEFSKNVSDRLYSHLRVIILSSDFAMAISEGTRDSGKWRLSYYVSCAFDLVLTPVSPNQSICDTLLPPFGITAAIYGKLYVLYVSICLPVCLASYLSASISFCLSSFRLIIIHTAATNHSLLERSAVPHPQLTPAGMDNLDEGMNYHLRS